MKLFANALSNPRTSTAGVLIATMSVASVLSQQGVTLGKVGSGSVVGLVSGVAAALLGIMAKDPGPKPATVPADKQN